MKSAYLCIAILAVSAALAVIVGSALGLTAATLLNHN